MNRKHKLLSVLAFILLAILACNFPGVNQATPALIPETGTKTNNNNDNQPDTTAQDRPANTDGAETIFIPGAAFWMGSEETDLLAQNDEMPFHSVTVDDFYIYTHEVTNAMYRRCVEAGGCLPVHAYKSGPTSHYEDSEYSENPVVGVDWNMARDYCVWAGGRLPTEAEWELASRSDESLLYPWGTDEPACSRVNMFGCSVPPDTVKVGSYKDGNSKYEVWDMSGNAWEWVNDWYDDDYYFLSAKVNPIGPYYGELKVARGGGLYSEPDKMRSATRSAASPYRPFDDVGFRCVPTGEAFPEELILPEDRHEIGAPDSLDGGGESLDDSQDEPGEHSMDKWTYSDTTASCPDREGMIHFFIPTETWVPVEYEVSYRDVPYSCEYDEALRGLQCEGPMPEDGASPYLFMVRAGEPIDYPIYIHITIPEDCPDEADLSYGGVSIASCPNEEGLVSLSIRLTPAILSLDSYDLHDREGECELNTPNNIICTLRGLELGDMVGTILYLTWETGESEIIYTLNHVPEDCPEDLTYSIHPECYEGHQGVVALFRGSAPILENVFQDGVPLPSCVEIHRGSIFCGDVIGDPGTSTTITVCPEGHPCMDFPMTILGCPPTTTITDYSVNSHCYSGRGPVLIINYSPVDFALTSAHAGGADLTCYDDLSHPGFYVCGVLPGESGNVLPVEFCLSDGTCQTGSVSIPGCEEGGETNGFWNLLDVNCFHKDEIYMIIDTPLTELTSGVEFSYDVGTSDHAVTYSCELHPTIAGRIFCWGEMPIHESSLSVCVSTPGAEEICNTFTDFWGRLPICLTAVTEVPTEAPGSPGEPEEPQVPTEAPTEAPLPDCSSYGSPFACDADSRCYWYVSSSHPAGYCRTR